MAFDLMDLGFADWLLKKNVLAIKNKTLVLCTSTSHEWKEIK